MTTQEYQEKSLEKMEAIKTKLDSIKDSLGSLNLKIYLILYLGIIGYLILISRIK
jgi:hypothetical protein